MNKVCEQVNKFNLIKSWNPKANERKGHLKQKARRLNEITMQCWTVLLDSVGVYYVRTPTNLIISLK